MATNCRNLGEIALEVIAKEAEAIQNQSSVIDENFSRVVNLIKSIKGRVVITGVGKSGIIASKIVATMNSTGTKAQFLHAADAMHGDLGMVSSDDVVIVISKSGDTAEIKNLVPYVRNIGAPIVAMVSNLDSYLASNADYILYAPVKSEACLCNLAPTVSTTVHLVLGDALAVALEQEKMFTAEDFARVHPGGTLGTVSRNKQSL